MQSAQSLALEGFTKEMESENEKMYKALDSLKKKSSLLKERSKVSQVNQGWMDVIEEDVLQEESGTDFKKKRSLGQSTDSYVAN